MFQLFTQVNNFPASQIDISEWRKKERNAIDIISVGADIQTLDLQDHTSLLPFGQADSLYS
jgi:hypothetical protein